MTASPLPAEEDALIIPLRRPGHDHVVPAEDAPASAGGRTPPSQIDDVVREHLPSLLRYATMLTGSGHTAADLVQEVLLRAHVRWNRIGLLERPDLYLRRMVTNEHVSWRRRWHVRMVQPVADEVLAANAGSCAGPADRVARDEEMWQRLTALSPRQRAVIVLRYYEDLGDAEIGAVLGTSCSTVRWHASRALAALRDTEPCTASESR